jgi:hypothetical protein
LKSNRITHLNPGIMDRAMSSLAIKLDLDVAADAEFRGILISRINDLILNDFNKLVQILYQVDVDESNLRKLLNQRSSTDAGEIIADLLIEREQKKAASREQQSGDHDVPESEKW